MGEKSEIQFCDTTWNPWQGCHKVSAGCQFCYMMRDKERYGQDGNVVVRSKQRTFRMPLRLVDPTVIFTCSWSDWFIEEADAWRAEAWEIIRQTPHHFYQIFTKRIERAAACLPADWGAGYANVMLVATVENQDAAEKRVPVLMRTPARWRGVSAEPLLGNVILDRLDVRHGQSAGWTNALHFGHRTQRPAGEREFGFVGGLHWLVIGGESGNETGYYRYRPCELEWIADLVQQGKSYGVPTFVKQTGTHLAKLLGLADRHGGELQELPTWAQVRQHPAPIAKILEARAK